jgi:hypothetical protein
MPNLCRTLSERVSSNRPLAHLRAVCSRARLANMEPDSAAFKSEKEAGPLEFRMARTNERGGRVAPKRYRHLRHSGLD